MGVLYIGVGFCDFYFGEGFAMVKVRSNSPWVDENYLKIFFLARSGLSNKRLCESLGVKDDTFRKWMEVRPAFKAAIEAGREERAGQAASFMDYVYKRMPPKLQRLYEQLCEYETSDNATVRVEALLAGQGDKVRKHLFLHALVDNAFNPSEACRVVGVSKGQLKRWKTDPEFQELLDEVLWHKKNYFEEALVRLVQQGDTAAVIFANKTQNQDRGYGAKLAVEHRGQVEHKHLVDLDSLALPLAVRQAILTAIEARKAEQAKLGDGAIDVPFTEAVA